MTGNSSKVMVSTARATQLCLKVCEEAATVYGVKRMKPKHSSSTAPLQNKTELVLLKHGEMEAFGYYGVGGWECTMTQLLWKGGRWMLRKFKRGLRTLLSGRAFLWHA